MTVKSSQFLTMFSVAIVMVVVFPTIVGGVLGSEQVVDSTISPVTNLDIIVRTIMWSIGVGIVATGIGWPLGIRLASVRPNIRTGIIAGMCMSLAVPAYAVFYAWWQLWPSGTWLHGYLVEHGLLGPATKACAAIALVGWSWSIPALIAAMASRSDNRLSILHRLDGMSLPSRIVQRCMVDKQLIAASILLVTALTAANTTCFDLAQIHTVGNELRALFAVGGSIGSAWGLSFFGLIIAMVASLVLLRFAPRKHRSLHAPTQSCVPIVVSWCLLTGGPLLLSALSSLGEGGLLLWKHYGGDMAISGGIGLFVAVLCVVILVCSSAMHLSLSRNTRILATLIDFAWILVAFLPASLVASTLAHAWHTVGVEYVYRTPMLLVLAHVARVGFVASLAGRWIGSCTNTQTLCQIDGTQRPFLLFAAIRPRVFAAICVVVGVTFAMSLGEVAMTSQLSPPAKHQPIAVALLSAMHYQRPQIVTSALFVIVSVAAIGGFIIALAHRKCFSAMVFLCVLAACDAQKETPIPIASVIGGAGLVDGQFNTPRAIGANDEVIVVIDKSGRLQRFEIDGHFLSSWELQLSGRGFPTGVSIDDFGLIWIADTHEHRVLVLDHDGNEVLQFGSYGTEEGQFLYPTDIAFGDDGMVFVSEYGGNDRINVFDRDGKFHYSFGHHSEDETGFKRPQSIAIDKTTGNLFITDSGNHRIVVYTPCGELVQIISETGRESGQFLYPYGIVFDTPTSFIVCEFGNNRIQRFSVDGVHLESWGGAGADIGLFKTPWGVATTKHGIVVADTGNNRLQLLPDMMRRR